MSVTKSVGCFFKCSLSHVFVSPSSIVYILTSWILPLKTHNYSTVGSNTSDAATLYNSFVHLLLCLKWPHLLVCVRHKLKSIYFIVIGSVISETGLQFSTQADLSFKLWGPCWGRWIFISFCFTFDKSETPSHSQSGCRRFFTLFYRGKACCRQKSINDLSCRSLKRAAFKHPTHTCIASLLCWEAANSIRTSSKSNRKKPWHS